MGDWVVLEEACGNWVVVDAGDRILAEEARAEEVVEKALPEGVTEEASNAESATGR